MRIPGFGAEASLTPSPATYCSALPISWSRRVSAIPQDMGRDSATLTGYRTWESCTTAWVLCTLWQDPWSCFVYYTFPECDPLHVSR